MPAQRTGRARLLLALLIGVALSLSAAPEMLKITVVEGEGAINNIRERSAHAPVVRVDDENGRPVAGAHVTFTLPDLGAGGTFSNGQSSVSTITGRDGRAVGWGLRPNNVAGRFQIHVTSTYGGLMARTNITQTNAAPGVARGNATKKIVIAGLAAGAVAGVVLATRGGSNPASSPAPTGPTGTTITPGSPVFGPPR